MLCDLRNVSLKFKIKIKLPIAFSLLQIVQYCVSLAIKQSPFYVVQSVV